MNRVVWKYRLPTRDCTLALPRGAQVLHFGIQVDAAYIWVLLTPEQVETEQRTFAVVGTGEEFTIANRAYLGTALTPDGIHVWHLWEITQPISI